MFVDSESKAMETWVEPNVFYSALLDCSVDFHKLMSNVMTHELFGDSTHADKVVQYMRSEFISDEKRSEMQKEIEEQLVKSRVNKVKNNKEINKIKHEARVLGMTTEQLNAVMK